MELATDLLVAFVALYPVVTSAIWVVGGVLYGALEEHRPTRVPDVGWPGVTVLIPAYNEASVIAASVRAALASDYPTLEVLVLDDGSTDGTAAIARAETGGDRRCEIVRDPVNRGKAERLNAGFARARHDLVVVTDADAHLHPEAVALLVARLLRSPLMAAVAGAPHVTNPSSILGLLQAMEAPSVIGLIRRTQALTGRVGTVAGVLGIFRRERVLAVGGYDGRMITEDIDVSWRLLLAGWHTGYEPRALVGMEVPTTFSALWAQRKRWAQGQGEVLHKHGRSVTHWGNHRMWMLSIESVASMAWVGALVVAVAMAAFDLALGGSFDQLYFGLAWGVAVSILGTLQMAVGLRLESGYDPRAFRAFLLGPLYPLAFWMLSAAASLRSQGVGLAVGPHDRRVGWDVPREQLWQQADL